MIKVDRRVRAVHSGKCLFILCALVCCVFVVMGLGTRSSVLFGSGESLGVDWRAVVCLASLLFVATFGCSPVVVLLDLVEFTHLILGLCLMLVLLFVRRLKAVGVMG